MGWGFAWWVAIVFAVPCIAMLYKLWRGYYEETEKLSFLSFGLIMLMYLVLKF